MPPGKRAWPAESRLYRALLELEAQRHRHLPRVRRRGVTAQAGVGLLQYASLPEGPRVRGSDVGAGELGVVEDVVRLRPEHDLPPLALQREDLGEGHAVVERARTGDRDEAARSGVSVTGHRLAHALLRSRPRRPTARVGNHENALIEKLIAGRPVGVGPGRLH